MRSMPNIALTDADYEILVHAGRFSRGGEAIICRSDRTDTLYKMFIERNSTSPRVMCDNKFKKVVEQYVRQLEHSVRPTSTISLNGTLIGYELTYDDRDVTLCESSLKRQELIYFLNQIKNILRYYDSEDITYGDIKSDNILINRRTGKAKFCDMDNVRMGEYPIDLIGYDLACFEQEHGSLDDTTHAYMHNLLTLGQLNYRDSTYQDIIYTLNVRNYPRGFKRAVRPIMDSIARAENFKGEYVIEYTKK